MGTTGFGVSNPWLSAAGPGRVTVALDLVYSLPPSVAPVLRVCKGSLGSAQAVLVRTTTATPTQVASLADPGGNAVPADDCSDAASATAKVSSSSLIGPTTWPPEIDTHRRVLAFYYPWYDAHSFDNPSAWIDTPARPWNTDDPTQVTQMVSQAAGAGIDGFIVSYNTNATLATRMAYVAQAATAHPGFFISPLIELGQMTSVVPGGTLTAPEVASAITQAVGLEGAAGLKLGTRPVVFIYSADLLGSGTWAQIEQDLAGMNPVLVGDSTSSTDGFGGLYSYSPNVVSNDSALAGWDADSENTARFTPAVHPSAGPQRLWAAPASPGMNNSLNGLPPADVIAIPRENNGARYTATWQAAWSSQPEWSLVTTWNEWYEATNVSPGVQTGTLALSQTQTWANWFHQLK
jgi:hypothetical protein